MNKSTSIVLIEQTTPLYITHNNSYNLRNLSLIFKRLNFNNLISNLTKNNMGDNTISKICSINLSNQLQYSHSNPSRIKLIENLKLTRKILNLEMTLYAATVEIYSKYLSIYSNLHRFVCNN